MARAIRSKKLASVRAAQAIRSKKFVSRSNGSSYPFEKIRQRFKRFELFVQKNCQPFERLELSVLNNLSAVRTARAIGVKKRFVSLSREWLELSCSKKFVNHSNGSSYPFKKICQPFERHKLSVNKNS